MENPNPIPNQQPPAPPVSPNPEQTPPPAPSTPPLPAPHKELDNHTLIAILLLVFVYPIGLIFMWFMTHWPRWLKILLTLPIPLALLGLALTTLLVAKDPLHKLDRFPTPTITQSPTPTDETANWKTYKGIMYSFKYPNDWEVIATDKVTITIKPVINSGPIRISGKTFTGSSDSYIQENYYSQYMENSTKKNISNPLYTVTEYNIKYAENAPVYGAGTTRKITVVESGNKKIAFENFTASDEPLGQILSTFKFTNSSDETAQSFLEIPEYGVKFALTDPIKDAYYLPSTADKGYVYLKVHSLDSEPQCAKDESSTAALSKVGKDDINEMSGMKYSDAGNGVTIGNYYYYIDLAQYECAESVNRKATLVNVRKAFSEASKTITSL